MSTVDELRAENERLHKMIQGLLKDKYNYHRVGACCGSCVHAALGKCEFVEGYIDNEYICDGFKSKESELEEIRTGNKNKTKDDNMAALKAVLNRPKE